MQLFDSVLSNLNIEVEDVLQGQVFGEHMMENLINDLLDIAKMENNTFTFVSDYFSLSQLLYEAFNMIAF